MGAAMPPLAAAWAALGTVLGCLLYVLLLLPESLTEEAKEEVGGSRVLHHSMMPFLMESPSLGTPHSPLGHAALFLRARRTLPAMLASITAAVSLCG